MPSQHHGLTHLISRMRHRPAAWVESSRLPQSLDQNSIVPIDFAASLPLRDNGLDEAGRLEFVEIRVLQKALLLLLVLV